MRILTLMLLLYSLAFSYQKGDTLSEDIQKKLDIKADKIYIIDFFASWCPSCEKEMPYISKVNEKIDKTKIKIIGIGVDEDIKKGQKFQKKLKDRGELNFQVIDDPKNLIIKEFNPIGMPALFYIKDKKVVKTIFGAVDDIDKIILSDLKELE